MQTAPRVAKGSNRGLRSTMSRKQLSRAAQVLLYALYELSKMW